MGVDAAYREGGELVAEGEILLGAHAEEEVDLAVGLALLEDGAEEGADRGEARARGEEQHVLSPGIVEGKAGPQWQARPDLVARREPPELRGHPLALADQKLEALAAGRARHGEIGTRGARPQRDLHELAGDPVAARHRHRHLEGEETKSRGFAPRRKDEGAVLGIGHEGPNLMARHDRLKAPVNGSAVAEQGG